MRVVLLAGLLLATPAHAASWCFEPTEPVGPPFCIDSYSTFQSEWAFDSCRRELESYIAEVESYTSQVIEYMDCLDQARIEQINRANEAIETFNCGAERGRPC